MTADIQVRDLLEIQHLAPRWCRASIAPGSFALAGHGEQAGRTEGGWR